MTTLRKKLYELLKEKKARTAATHHNVGLTNQASTQKAPGHEWLDFIKLTDDVLEKKLEGLPEKEMLELYKKLERETGFRHDPENYKRHKIIKNFMILWTSKKEDEERKKSKGEELVPMAGAEIDQVMSNRGLRSRISLISKRNDDDK